MPPGSAFARESLVTLQFAVLIGLMIVAFASPLAAVGQTLQARPFGGPQEYDAVIAVIPDFSLSSVEKPIPATAYYVPDSRRLQLVNVKLSGQDVPATSRRSRLRGFAYHTQLAPGLFVGSGALALLIALLTVSTHSILVARSKTAAALRYE